MKRLGTALAFLLASSVAYAQQSPPVATPDTGKQSGIDKQTDTGKPSDTGKKADVGEKAKGKKEFTAEVVSMDVAAKTLTFKKKADAKKKDDTTTATMDMAEMTLPVDTKAESSLAKLSAGDQVKLVCKTDASGKEVVSKIERVDTRPASDAPPNP